ncbi:MAG: sensor histidine kinase [Chitinispirillaceae bacterium]
MDDSSGNRHTVLLLTPTGEDASVLNRTLSKGGIRTCRCADMEDISRKLDETFGTAIIAEEVLTPHSVRLLAGAVQRQPEWSDFPLIIMAGAESNLDTAWAILGDKSQALNINVLERPVFARTLFSAVRSTLRSRATQYRVAEELQARRKAEEGLKTANEELQAFSYSVSHDLRSPLRTVRGFSTFLKEDYSDILDETGKDFLDRIVRGVDQMGMLIDDMLSLSRVSNQEMVTEEVDLSALARSVVNNLQQNDPERRVEVRVEDELSAFGDQRLLQIAFANLLGNAWKYTSKTDNPRIEIGSFSRNRETVYYVKDNGAGFSMDLADRLFKPFQRLHTDKEFSGTGIGLPIVGRVIRRHGGRIWTESEPGKGAVFYFTLK